MRIEAQNPRRRTAAKGVLALAAVAGLTLGVAAGAGANSAVKSGSAAFVDVFQLIPPEGLAFTLFGAGSTPSPTLASATIGQVTPPSPDYPILRGFDAVRSCAEYDLQAAALDKLVERPKLARLEQFWEAHGLEMKSVALGAPVPPLLMDRLPPSFADDDMDVRRKKQAFILMLLPHVLVANQEILADRARIVFIRDNLDEPTGPSDEDIAWLFDKFEAYGVDSRDLDTLLARVDVIPPALAIAQAAKESGWGGSRFAQLGNALYGQWTWNPEDDGIVPRSRPAGKTYRVRAFDSVLAATRAYAININSHPAYGRLREIRLEMRRSGKIASGAEFAVALDKYATIGQRYVRALKHIIRTNDLAKLNNAVLAPGLAPPPQTASEPMRADKLASNG